MTKRKETHAPPLPRPEYPRPPFVRADWVNLNGTWTFAFDPGKSGMESGLAKSKGFDREILVPFCPESKLSGVAHTDFIEMMWYHRTITVPEGWAGRLILLHFGAVDYECEAFIDGLSAGRHRGGSVSFAFDITRFVTRGRTHDLVLCVRDETRSGAQPCGKQSGRYESYGCHYTRTTGIWQTVWLEPVSPVGLSGCHIVPDLDGRRFVVTPTYHAVRKGMKLRAVLKDGEHIVDKAEVAAVDGAACVLKANRPKPWSPESPFLYSIEFSTIGPDGEVADRVESYAGLRKVHVEGDRLYLNNEPLYLRFVLDQGFYPEGVWTAPSDEALRRDIELSMAAGFNGARLHQKVFEERFHYWADMLGYLTWAEFPSWGIDIWAPGPHTAGTSRDAAWNLLSEWREAVVRDRNHPSIVAWTPLNETWLKTGRHVHHRFHSDIYDLTKALDPTRPVNDSSGYVHVKTDLWTVHNYEQDAAKLKSTLAPAAGAVWRNFPADEADYAGQPYIVDEFGGIKWIPEGRRPWAADSWGYGEGPRNIEEFYKRLEALVDVLVTLKHVRGYCYTQLTDVEQEQNGIYLYDRSPKFDMARIRKIFTMEPE